MSAPNVHVQGLIPALRRAGFSLPEDVRFVEIHAGLDEVMTLRFEVHITRAQLPMLADVFADLATEYVSPGTEFISEPGNGLNHPAEPQS